MMKLLMKEYKLTACPLTFIFLGFAWMTMIPGYPILVGAFFICLGILYTFQFAREYNDTLYTALLPVAKSDVVKSRFIFVISIQMIGFLVSAILTFVRMGALSDAAPYVNNLLMNANFIYLGAYLLILTLFNTVFVTGFFKTGYYYGKAFVVFTILAFLVIGIMETIHHIPGMYFLNTCSFTDMGVQIGALIAGIVVYVFGTIWALKKSVKEFETIDL